MAQKDARFWSWIAKRYSKSPIDALEVDDESVEAVLALGLFPMLRIFKVNQIVDSVLAAGFEIDFQWQPEASPTLFLVAKKQASL